MISPLKEGSSYKCGAYLKTLIPAHSIVDSFLFYSGQLELGLAQSDRIVRAHTNRYVIYEFWYCMQEDPERIVEMVQYFHEKRHPISTQLLQDRWYGEADHYVRAAMFLLLNAYSTDGKVSSGALNFSNYNPLLLNRVKNCSFENLRINFYKDENFLKGIDYLENSDYIVIPVGKFDYNLFEEGKSYGHETTPVNHTHAKLKVDACDHKTIVIYKSHKEVLRLYEDYNITMLDRHGRPTPSFENSQELVIANF